MASAKHHVKSRKKERVSSPGQLKDDEVKHIVREILEVENKPSARSYPAKNFKIKYPAASSFLDWLFHHLRKHAVPFSSPETDGDYYCVKIGDNNKRGKSIMLDWKHLDIGEIEAISRKLREYGFCITVEDEDWTKVSFRKLPLLGLS
jgi:hypothetical protein